MPYEPADAMPLRPEQLVVSVEHARPDVPAALSGLGLPDAFLQTHWSFDPGAAAVGRTVARHFGAPLHLGRWSRLVADLNRTARHPRVIARNVDGRHVPGNALDRGGRQERLASYWHPYRSAVEADLDRVAEEHGRVLHLSVHTFTPALNGHVRNADFGLLYKPSHKGERPTADRWDRQLSAAGFRVRRNYPYSGLDDGFCMRMRAERSDRSYLGMEIEMNQAWLARSPRLAPMAQAMIEVLSREFRV